ncbi:TetR/AcrR family transcriptional regulator [Paenibacillus sp. WLX2291]|uniref:TetR/AcrR family transcriptional regulator n=1 Tax=Paenibacillus sp. WLX2291 TaxID=3296934 RepID=UPI003983F500
MIQEDRRIRKTKNALIKSLMILLNNRDIKNVTVTDICVNADINRSTFYQYYNNPFDMLEQIEETIFKDFINKWEKSKIDSEIPDISEWLEIIYTNQSYCKLIFRKTYHSKMLIKLLSISDYEFQKNIKSMYPNLEKREVEYICDFCSYGTVAIITKWIDEGL